MDGHSNGSMKNVGAPDNVRSGSHETISPETGAGSMKAEEGHKLTGPARCASCCCGPSEWMIDDSNRNEQDSVQSNTPPPAIIPNHPLVIPCECGLGMGRRQHRHGSYDDAGCGSQVSADEKTSSTSTHSRTTSRNTEDSRCLSAQELRIVLVDVCGRNLIGSTDELFDAVSNSKFERKSSHMQTYSQMGLVSVLALSFGVILFNSISK
eukprot:GHVU01031032.1.p1 GENE.GHVU01031032.1~~GHVU01031032.1.p1  ORF type:complete len:209 (+),score=16.42 GHVU01031032.1:293-919(+)